MTNPPTPTMDLAKQVVERILREQIYLQRLDDDARVVGYENATAILLDLITSARSGGGDVVELREAARAVIAIDDDGGMGVIGWTQAIDRLEAALSRIEAGGGALQPQAPSVPTEGQDGAVLAVNHFTRGAQACREMMARFVGATHPEIATSIRLNWHGGWGTDPGKPPFVVDTWEPAPCPEGEALYASYQASEHAPEPDLALTARMLETWGPVVDPATPDGCVTFTRGLMASAAESIRAYLNLSSGAQPECETCEGSGKIVEEAVTTGSNQHSACQQDCEDCDGTGHQAATPDGSQAEEWQRFREDDSAMWSAWEEWPDGFGDVHDLLVWNACDGLHIWSRGLPNAARNPLREGPTAARPAPPCCPGGWGMRLTFNKWAFGGRRIWPVLRVGSWLFAIHRLWRWKPLTDRFEPDPFTEETRTGWSVVWLCVEVSHVR